MFPRESQHRCHSVFSALGLNILLCWAWIKALNIWIHISAMAGRVEVFKSVSLDWPDAHLWSLRSLFRISDILKDVNKVQCLALIRVLITAIKWSGYLTVDCQPHTWKWQWLYHNPRSVFTKMQFSQGKKPLCISVTYKPDCKSLTVLT